MRITNKLLNSVLSERDTYKAAYQAGGNHLFITLVFCELLAAHCIEVYDTGKEGEPTHLYKMRDGIDISLLKPLRSTPSHPIPGAIDENQHKTIAYLY